MTCPVKLLALFSDVLDDLFLETTASAAEDVVEIDLAGSGLFCIPRANETPPAQPGRHAPCGLQGEEALQLLRYTVLNALLQ